MNKERGNKNFKDFPPFPGWIPPTTGAHPPTEEHLDLYHPLDITSLKLMLGSSFNWRLPPKENETEFNDLQYS